MTILGQAEFWVVTKNECAPTIEDFIEGVEELEGMIIVSCYCCGV